MAKRTLGPDIVVGPEQEVEWPGSSSLATACVLNTVALGRRMLDYGLAIAMAHGVPSVAGFNVLTILDGNGGPLPPSVIAERMILTRGTLTGILDSLERRGLIRRTRASKDGRMRQVRITPAGRRKVARILPGLHEAERRWMEALPEPQQRELLRLVSRLQAAGPDRVR